MNKSNNELVSENTRLWEENKALKQKLETLSKQKVENGHFTKTYIENAIAILKKEIRLRQKAEQELKNINKTLEQRVEKRTVELKTELEKSAKLQEKSKHLAERLKKIIKTINEGIILCDTKGKCLMYNPQMKRITGYSKSEVKTIDLLLKKINVSTTEQGEEVSLRTFSQLVEKSKREIIFFDSKSRRRIVVLSLTKIKHGQQHFHLCVFRDITEIKNSQQKIYDQYAEIQSQNEELSSSLEELRQSNEQLSATTEQLMLSEYRLETLWKLMQMQKYNDQEILNFALESAIAISGSQIGFFFLYNEDKKELKLHSWSKDIMKECKVKQNFNKLKLTEAGIWAEAIKQRKVFVINCPQQELNRKFDMPPGHQNIKRMISIPVFDQNKIVALVGLANKSDEYDHKDERNLLLLLDGVVKIINQRRMNKALIISQEKLSQIFNTSPDAIFVGKINGELTDCNPAALDLLSIKNKSEITEKNVFDYIIASRDFKTEAKKSLKELKPLKNVEVDIRTRKFPLMPLEVSIGFTKTGNDRPDGFVAIAKNIATRKMYQDWLKESKRKAEESDHLKSAFLANMSHEIRTPLNSIIGFTQLLQQEVNTETGNEFLSVIEKSGNHLLSLINDIIDVSKIEADQLKIEYKEFNLNDLIRDVYMVFKSDSRLMQNPNIEFGFQPGLPDNVSYIVTDEVRLRQILNNLIANAIKFTSKGFVKFGYDIRKEKLNFYVKDTGIGMSESKKEHIFDRFYQIDDTNKRKYQGTGLGLAISKGLIELLGGSISVETELDKGTSFLFDIPYQPAKNIIKPTFAQQNENEQTLNYNWKDKVILIVEDNLNNCLFLEKLLEEYDAEIYHTENGVDAVNFCKKEKVDIVLMDLQIPEMDGITATRKIKEFKPGLPVIAQTANAMGDAEQRCKIAGCELFLTKPLKSHILLREIDRLLKQK